MKRGLRLEPLETRQLLAADVDVLHNFAIPEDTNGDGSVTPVDALLGINALNRGDAGASDSFLDVNANGLLEPIDSLVAINLMNRAEGEAASTVPLSNRIARIRDAINSDNVPARFGLGRAQEILETLENGGRPELGEVITNSRLNQLRETIIAGETPVVDAVFDSLGIQSSDNIVDQVESALQGFGIDITNVSNSIQELVGTLPESGSQIADQVVDILNNLGSSGQSLGDQLSNLLSSEDVGAIVSRVESVLSEAGVDIDSLQQQLQDLIDSVADDGVPLAESVIDVVNNSLNDGTLRDEILRLLETEELSSIRSAVDLRLDQFGIDVGIIRSTVDQFASRLASGETPVQDWLAGLITSSQPGGIASQLFAESESLGANIDNLIDSISGDVAGISASVNQLVDDLTSGNASVGQFVDEILDGLSSDGSSSIGSLVDNVLGNVDGLLDNLFPGDDFLDSLLDGLL